MSDQERESLPGDAAAMEPEQRERRNFLLGLGKWSKAVVGGVLLGGVLAPGRDARAWGWANGGGGRGGSWVNFRGWPWGWGYRPGWYNRPYWGGGWYNGGPGWFNGPYRGWANRGPGWANGGGGGGWFNSPGWGGSWVNR